MDMDSVPPATATSPCPAIILCAAIAMACSPEEQKRLMVIAADSTGSPARKEAIRATFMPCSPSGMAQPITTSSTSLGSSPFAWATASLITMAPRSSGREVRSVPFADFPTAVLTELTITASCMIHLRLVRETHSRKGCETILDAVGGKKQQRGMIRAVGVTDLRPNLAAELNGHQHLHGDGLSIQLRRLVSPAPQRVQCGLPQQQRTGYHVHVDDVSFLVDSGLNDDVAANTGLFGVLRIYRQHLGNQPRLGDLSARYHGTIGVNFRGRRGGHARRRNNTGQRVSAGAICSCPCIQRRSSDWLRGIGTLCGERMGVGSRPAQDRGNLAGRRLGCRNRFVRA